MKAFVFVAALALLVQCGQSRQLLEPAPAAQVKCVNSTIPADCATYTPDGLWGLDGTKDVWDNETDIAVINGACCVFNATAGGSCANVTCGMDRIKRATAADVSVAGKLWVEAEVLCCEPAFTANDNCTSITPAVVCPVMTKPALAVDGQLVLVAKSDVEGQRAVCCEPLPACDTTECPAGMTMKGNTSIPDTEADRVSFCCLYPANATCDDIDSPQNNATTEALNCTAEAAMGAYAFQVAEPAAFKRNGEAPVDIAGQNFFQALDLCCEKVQYADSATCATNFNCTLVAPAGSMIDNPTAVNESLAGINVVNETGVAAICCSPALVPGTVASWLEGVAACNDLDVSKAKTVEGKATLVEGSADDTCPKTCIAEATIVITIEGDCRYAVFTPNGTDCSVAAGTVAINATTGIMTGIDGAFPANQAAFAVTPVEGAAKQVEVAIGETCKAKYILDDALFARLAGEPTKNSATGKAVSFLAAVLALLAILVL